MERGDRAGKWEGVGRKVFLRFILLLIVVFEFWLLINSVDFLKLSLFFSRPQRVCDPSWSLPEFFVMFSLLYLAVEGVRDCLWWVPGIQPGSTHHSQKKKGWTECEWSGFQVTSYFFRIAESYMSFQFHWQYSIFHGIEVGIIRRQDERRDHLLDYILWDSQGLF